MSILEQLKELQANYYYDRDKLDVLTDQITEAISPAECWNTIRDAFSESELIENLIYIAEEHDL